MTDEEKPKNGLAALLASVVSGGDQTVKLATLALVALTGGGNLFATKQAERSTDHEIQKAVREIHEIHAVFDSSVQRQKRLEQMLQDLKDKNANR